MGAAAKFHGVAIQLLRPSADLHHPHDIAVLVAKELLDIRTLLRFRVRNFPPRDRRLLRDLVVNQLLDRAHLLAR